MLRATAACHFWRSTSQIAPRCGVLWILPVKCASRHRGVPFIDIGTSKTAPQMWCFVDFDCNTCFAPQRRAIFHVRCRQNSIAAKWNIFLSFGLKVPFGFPCFAHVRLESWFGLVFFSTAYVILVVALLFGGLVLLLAFL